jgi:peptidoglycan hydrolase CwlO-like protein
MDILTVRRCSMAKKHVNLNLNKNAEGLGKPVLIILIVLAALVVGGIGYTMGKNKAEDDARAKYDQQVQTLQADLNEATAAASEELQEGQEAVTEGQQTLESLQTENAQLKTTIEEQNAKIADLEQQLEDAQDTTQPQ